jgi:large subunit ribosomal protein L37Ae
MAEAKLKSIRRFGSRYGRTPKKRFGKIEQVQRSLHKCPFCSNVKVKRMAAGIWQCRKCDKKFTGKAYTISKRKRKVEAVAEDVIIDDDYDLEQEEFQGVVPDKGKELKVKDSELDENKEDSENTETDEDTEAGEEDLKQSEEADEEQESDEEDSNDQEEPIAEDDQESEK